jgi:endo-1,4-beta-xylanase
MHVALDSPPTADELAENIQRLSNIGLRVHITEMDVRIQYSLASEESKLTSQAEMFRRVFTVCLEAIGCEAFITWGPTDRHSWIPGYTGNPDAPLLFDKNYGPKPAYDAIMEVLEMTER